MDRRPAEPLNVLFTSVGRRVEVMRAFRAAYRTLGIGGQLVGLDVDPLAPALHVVDRPHLVPRGDAPDFLPRLLEICRTERIALVIPLIDPDIPLLARHRARIEATGARVAVVSDDAVRTTTDKWLTTELFRSLGLAVPRSWLPGMVDPDALDYPVFIKPRNGSAGKDAYVVRSARELSFFVDYVPAPIIQELLPGPEISSDVFCALDGEVLGVVSRRRIAVRAGEVAKGVTVNDPRIIDACVRIARALPAVGPITVQCMMRDGVPYFTEINARFGGGAPLGIAAGVNGPLFLLARAAGVPVAIPPLGTYASGLYMTRFDDSFMLSESERAAFAASATAPGHVPARVDAPSLRREPRRVTAEVRP